MLNSANKINILTLVLSEKIFLNKTKNHNPCKLNGRSLIFLSSNCRHNGFHYITLVLDDTFSDHDRIKVSGTTVKVKDQSYDIYRHVQQYFSYIVAGRGSSSRSTIFQLYRGGAGFIVNFNNISVISWRQFYWRNQGFWKAK